MDASRRALLLASVAALQACDSESETETNSTVSQGINTEGNLGIQAATALYLPHNITVTKQQLLADLETQSNDFYYELTPYLERYQNTDRAIEYFLVHLGHGNHFCKEYFDNWITYQLANTFSLAVGSELSTVSNSIVLTHVSEIRNAVSQDNSIRSFMLTYFLSEMFWARFRSPEDNGREVFEIYLGNFQDDLVPKAAKILQNYAFIESAGSLEKGLNENTEPQLINGQWLTTPKELYQYVVNHADFLPHVYAHVVTQLYGTADADVIASLKSQNIDSFRELYKQALLHPKMEKITRPKFPEEILLPVIQSGQYQLRRDGFTTFLNLMDQVGSKPMLSKLERQKPDWNALNIGNLSNFLETLFSAEASSFSSSWSYGYGQTTYVALSQLVDKPADLLNKAHSLLWRESFIYDAVFTQLIEQQVTTKDKITAALRIAAMNYAHYQFSAE